MGSAYDAETKRIYVRDNNGLWTYDTEADAWTRKLDFGYPPYYPKWQTYHYRSAAILEPQRYFVSAGSALSDGAPDFFVYDIDGDADVTASFTMSGDLSVIAGKAPGLAFDEKSGSLVAWSGGAPAIMDPATRAWSRGSAQGAPAQPVDNGTYGRFRYIAYLNVFVLVNGPSDPVHFYKLTAGCGASNP
ncbi:MAG: hypothetical protein QM765_33935 [Myxococcales bacterium]